MVGNAVPPRLAKNLALSIRETLTSVESGNQSKVLVAYYKDEQQLRIILLHNLYYVRMGIRRGALQMPVGAKAPNYLLLHNGSKRFLFCLVNECPVIVTASYLKSLGFNPSGNDYLLFKLKGTKQTAIRNLALNKLKLRGIGRCKALPYIIDISDLG